MKKTIFLLLLIPVAFSVSAQIDGASYNDMIVDEQTKIGNKIVGFSTAESNEDMELAHTILLQQVDASIAVIQKLGAWKGDGALQSSTLRLFNFYKSIVSVEYREILNLMKKEELSEADAARLDAITADIVAREATYDNDFAAQQEAFAARNGFDLTPAEEYPSDY